MQGNCVRKTFTHDVSKNTSTNTRQVLRRDVEGLPLARPSCLPETFIFGYYFFSLISLLFSPPHNQHHHHRHNSSRMHSQNLSGRWEEADPSQSFRSGRSRLSSSPRHSMVFPEAGAAAPMGTELSLRRRIELIYEAHAPDKLDKVDEMIERYAFSIKKIYSEKDCPLRQNSEVQK